MCVSLILWELDYWGAGLCEGSRLCWGAAFHIELNYMGELVYVKLDCLGSQITCMIWMM